MKVVMLYVFAIFMVLAGANHFINPDLYVRIMPPYLPWHLELVYLSGFFEIALGIMLLVPRISSLAAWGCIALLLAVFPANVHMALHTDDYPRFSPTDLWLRLPLQAVLIAWAYWFTRKGNRQEQTGAG
jgi:uncharacterized membrane protein